MSPPETSPEAGARLGQRPPLSELHTGPYADSREHLWDELRRVDQLVRAQTVRWRLTLGSDKPESLWGMVHVTDTEIENYLSAPFIPPGALTAELAAELTPYWQAAESLARAIDSRLAATPAEAEPRLERLRRLFDLSELERDVLLVCLLAETDSRYRRLFGYLQDDAARNRPSVDLVLQILQPVAGTGGGAAVLDAGAPLRSRRLITFGSSDRDEPLRSRALSLDHRIAAFLCDGDRPDARLRRVLTPAEELPHAAWLFCPPEQIERLEALAQWAGSRLGEPSWGATVFLHGGYGSGRLGAASAVCRALDRPLLTFDVAAALSSSDGFETVVELAFREAALAGAAVLWRGCEALLTAKQSERWRALLGGCERSSGLSFLASSQGWEARGRFRDRPFLRFELPLPDLELRRHIWATLLPPSGAFAEPVPDLDALAATLANSFQLTGGQIADVVAAVPALAFRRAPTDPLLIADDLYEGCRLQSSDRLERFARRVEPRSGLDFDNLVLPSLSRRLLEELRGRIQHRHRLLGELGFQSRLSLGRGLIVLFTGSSGTGKTMAAELLAREQGVDLYKIDLSSVVSKYVGETEKNLNQLFARAEDANAILFFDEADALFGKRGEVKDARDRWANLEVNFLLQRVEEYSGVVILTSNLRQNIDEAFVRRIHMIIEFPFPDPVARCRIWRDVFPPGLARPPEDKLRQLAKRFRLSGGEIKNIAVDAGYRALADAGDSEPEIALRHLAEATAREYQKAGKPVTRSEFGDELYNLLEL